MSTRYFQQTTVGGVPLTREISIRTASDAVTLPDNPGPGRTLDKALVWGGSRLERVITRVLSRIGRGPTSSVMDIVRAVYQSLMMPRACLNWLWQCGNHVPCGYCGPPRGITAPPTTYELFDICEWLVSAANAPRCPKCRARMTEQDIRTPFKSSKKLVKLISAANTSSCYISLQLFTLLVTIFPSSRQVLVDLGAGDILHELFKRMSDQLDMDPLLAYSRRALVSLADAEILSLGKELKVIHDGEGYTSSSLVVSQLIDCFSHTEKMLLALTVAHQFPVLLDPDDHPVLNTIYPTLLSRLASSSDPVEVAVLTDSLYQIINISIRFVPWLIHIKKTRPQLLEHISYRLRCLIDGLPAKYEQRAIDQEQYSGRRVNYLRRAIWRYDPDDPEGEPDDDWKFFKRAARDDGEYGYAKIDAVWWEVHVWETCDRRKRRLEGWEEQGTEDRVGERRGRDGHHGRQPRSHSMTITAWPDWMKERQKDEAEEWEKYWKGAQFVDFTGWPRRVRMWLERERVPLHFWFEGHDVLRMIITPDWKIFWTRLSRRMRSHSVD